MRGSFPPLHTSPLVCIEWCSETALSISMLSSATGAWTVSGTPTKLPQSSMRLSHSPYAPSHPSGLPRSPFQARPMPSLSAATGNSGSPGPSGQPGSGIDAGTADSASQAGNAEEGGLLSCPVAACMHLRPLLMTKYASTSHSPWLISVLKCADGLLHNKEQSRASQTQLRC